MKNKVKNKMSNNIKNHIERLGTPDEIIIQQHDEESLKDHNYRFLKAVATLGFTDKLEFDKDGGGFGLFLENEDMDRLMEQMNEQS